MFVVYGNPELDPGSWQTWPGSVTKEKPKGVGFRIRRLPFDKAQELEARYGEEKQITLGAQRVPARERTEEETGALLIDKAAFAWTESRDLEVVPGDDAARAIFSPYAQDAAAGSPVKVDGEVPDVVKRYLLSRYLDLVLWIVRIATESDKAKRAREAAAAKNS